MSELNQDELSALAAALADRYRVERELGRGGMATVYLARDLRHGRPVAVKVLRPELGASLGRDRFLREIELAAQLQHPGILPLHDSGGAGDLLYYLMPYVEGESLRARLGREGQLPVGESVRILREVLDALAYAHEKGVIHRDIKPDNVMLTSGHALVTDFGVAKALGDASGAGFVTTAGMALGTPAYMAPEQATGGHDVDHRADLYAVGVMGYELLAGRLPFVAANPQQLIAAHITQAPEPVRQHRAAVPPALEDVITRALAKLPADRWQSAREMLAQLEGLATPSGETPLAPPARRPRRAGLWVAGAVALAAVAGLALVFRSRSIPMPQFGRRIQVTLDPGLEIDPALSPDGRFVAYAAGGSANLEIRVRQVDGGAAVAVAPSLAHPQRWPVWSPDGRRILFDSPRGIEIVPALGGASRLVAADRPAARTDVFGSGGLLIPAGWSPDGQTVAFVRYDSLFTVPVEGGEPRLLAHGGEMHSPSWSPDGRWIACVHGNRQAQQSGFFFANRGPSGIWLLPAGGGDAVAVTDEQTHTASPVWTPRGRALLFISDRDGGLDVYRQVLTSAGRPDGRPQRLTTGLNALTMSLAPAAGRLAYSVFSETSNIWTLPVPSGGPVSVREAQPITSGNQVIEGFDVSTDGRWVVFDSDRNGTQDLYRMPGAGGEPERLTEGGGYWPRWSPDGTEISFHSFQNGVRHIFVMAADGGGRRQLTTGPGDDRAAAWGADGRSLYYLRDYNGPDAQVRRLARLRDGWGPPATAYHGDALPVAVSPDGGDMAFASGAAVMLVRVRDDSARVLVPAAEVGRSPIPTYVAWSDDGRTVFYLAVDAAHAAGIWAVPRSGGAPRQVVRFDDPTRQWHRFGFIQRGGRFYFTLGDRQSDIWMSEVTKLGG